MPYDDIIEKHARRVGINPKILHSMAKIESGYDPTNRTGSYHGLFQLSKSEFKAGGGTGDIYDPEQNTMATANKVAREALQFKQKHGRDATPTDIYMIHQQGAAGYDAHLANPDRPAWQNMLSTGEGRQKGEAWAKRAIWGNIPDKLKAQYGSVENVKSQDITSIYGAKMEGKGAVSGTEWARHRRAKGEEEGPMSRGLGREEEPEPKPFTPSFETNIPTSSIPSMQVPTVIGGMPMQAARGPRIPGATRWEAG